MFAMARWLCVLASVPQRPAVSPDEFVKQFSRGFGNEPEYRSLFLVGMGVLGLVVVIAIAIRIFRYRARRVAPPPPDYFTRALELLPLSPAEVNDLRVLRSRHRGAWPVAMLLCPESYAAALSEAADVEPDMQLMTRLRALGRRLFEESGA
ncbi:MAG: hypothetical protein CHACPFDD_00152 [Phycisphaerae bacterium]|nr:hypothetical protein [Phycisphaerae bacterium]